FPFFNDTPPTAIYPLSLHDALPIWPAEHRAALGEPRPLHDHDREGLPARPGRAARPLPRGVAARARGVADRGLARVPALRLPQRSEEHTSELQSLAYLVCRLLLEKK